jgi:lipopolysaccharide transport system ATP-binding protein
MDETVIEIHDLWKRYYLQSNDRPRSLKSALFQGVKYYTNREPYWALQGLNLNMTKGKTLGLIGNNGAGKSTLLRMISGLGRPTKGRVVRRGRLGTLLELGTGFQREFTGRENVITGSILSGLTRKEAEARLDSVVAFAELEDFIDVPVRTYSSGMYVRLAFATEITLDPDILLVDEVLAVGDLAFQKKCLNYLSEMREKGKTIIVVSHSMDQIEKVCDEVVWLEHGKVRAQGQTKEMIELYRNRIFEKTKLMAEQNQLALVGAGKSSSSSAPAREKRNGSLEIEITSTRLLTERGQTTNTIYSGDPVVVEVEYIAHKPITQPVFMVGLFNTNDVKCYETHTQSDGATIAQVEGKGSFRLYFQSLPLARGSYYLSVSAYQAEWDYIYEYCHHIADLIVEGPQNGTGIIAPVHRWQVE